MRNFSTILSFAISNIGICFLQCGEFVVGNITGQLGNQLFIIAATVSLALDNGADPLFPDLMNRCADNTQLNREKIFQYQDINVSSPIEKICYTHREPHFHYDSIPYIPNMALSGYFQSEKYFINHKEEIIGLFAAPEHILDHLERTFSNILENPKTVAIHHRSYLREDPSGNCHITLDMGYYSKAIAEFPDDYTFVVFSNDVVWCKKHFKDIPREIIYMEMGPHYYDFYLMSLCKHQIIGNSSYSWWAAYLNPNPNKKVLAPGRWFNPAYIRDTEDLIPEEWLIIRGF